MYLSLNKASKEAGISKSTLSEALNSGRLTAEKDDRGRWKIDPAALFQVFPKTSSNEHIEPKPNTDPNIENLIKIARLEAELEASKKLQAKAEETAEYVQRKLDEADQDRRNADARLEDLRAKSEAEVEKLQVKLDASNENPEPIGQGGQKDTRSLLARIWNKQTA